MDKETAVALKKEVLVRMTNKLLPARVRSSDISIDGNRRDDMSQYDEEEKQLMDHNYDS